MKATKGNRPLALLPLSEPEASGAPASASERPPTPLSRTRQVIARRMRESLQSTAQLTLSASADATALLAYRQRLKQRSGALGLPPVSLNDLVMFAVSRTLPRHGALNATFDGAAVTQHAAVHLGFAVDTPRGLLVPTIFDAQALSLAALAREAARLALACRDATVTPDELGGATFTVSNLGALGVESFTPILNPPQVAILGVGALTLRPVERAGAVTFAQHLGLSLTVDHQVVDGAPAARFLHALGAALAEVDLLTVGS